VLGANQSGQLGNDSATPNFRSRASVRLSGISAIVAYHSQSCVVALGAVYCWGDGNYQPTLRLNLTDGVTAIALGYEHDCVVRNGAANAGATTVGDNFGIDSDYSDVPVQVPGLENGRNGSCRG